MCRSGAPISRFLWGKWDYRRSHTEQLNSVAGSGCPQLPVQRSQRYLPSQGEFQIGRIVNRQAMTLGEMQSFTPRVPVGIGIEVDGKQSKLSQRCVAKSCRVP